MTTHTADNPLLKVAIERDPAGAERLLEVVHQADPEPTQLLVPPRTEYADFRHAAGLLWGDAGRWAVDESERWNSEAFDNELPPLPIVIGLTAYGRSLAVCRYPGSNRPLPRVTIHPSEFNTEGLRHASHVVLHELLHAWLMLRGENSTHNAAPWCGAIVRLSRRLFDLEIVAIPETNRRAATKARRAELGAISRTAVSSWPHSIIHPNYYLPVHLMPVDTY